MSLGNLGLLHLPVPGWQGPLSTRFSTMHPALLTAAHSLLQHNLADQNDVVVRAVDLELLLHAARLSPLYRPLSKSCVATARGDSAGAKLFKHCIRQLLFLQPQGSCSLYFPSFGGIEASRREPARTVFLIWMHQTESGVTNAPKA